LEGGLPIVIVKWMVGTQLACARLLLPFSSPSFAMAFSMKSFAVE
jgi:hypothetical protein